MAPDYALQMSPSEIASELIEIENLNSVCRLCLSENDPVVPIFNNLDNNGTFLGTTLSDRIMLCGTIKVEKNDGLPPNICRKCCEHINVAFLFQEQCRKSENILRKYISSLNPNEHVAEKLTEQLDNKQAEGNLEDVFGDEWLDPDGCDFPEGDDFLTPHDLSQSQDDDLELSDILEPNSEVPDIEKTDSRVTPAKVTASEESPTVKKSKPVSIDTKTLSPALKRSFYRCELCSKVCNSHSSLHYHRLKHSGHKPHRCSFCQKSFHQKCTLVKHERTHTGQRPYTCEKCGKSFSQDSNLKFHMTSHSGEKVFCCHVCGKRFTLGHNLKEHLKIHSGNRERMYGCDICGKSFYHRSHLTNHIRSHNNDKPYSCQTCGKTFIKNSYLKQHNRIHSGEKPYQCTTCGKSFSSNSNLTAHRRSHIGFKFTCNLCHKNFPSKSKMMSHIDTVHQSVTNQILTRNTEGNTLANATEKSVVTSVVGLPVSPISMTSENIHLFRYNTFLEDDIS